MTIGNVVKTKKTPIWEWFLGPIYSDLGGGLPTYGEWVTMRSKIDEH